MYVCTYICVCVECCGTSFVHTSVVRRLRLSEVFGDQGLVRSGATDGRGLAVCVYVTVNNINMGFI